MRALGKLFMVLGLVVGFPLGCVLLYWTIELTPIVEKTEPAAQVLFAADLAEKGAPKNLHVELKGFTFGKPVIEKNKREWEHAWLPIEIKAKLKTAPKHALFLRVKVRDQAELDEFLKQPASKMLVTTPLLKTSRWRVKSSPALRQAFPKVDMSQALFMAEPRLSVFGHEIELADELLRDPLYENLAAWGGGCLILASLTCLYLLVRRRPSAAPLPDSAPRRAVLEKERAESNHEAKTSGTLKWVAIYGLLAGILLFCAVLMAGSAILLQSEGKPVPAVMGLFIDVVLLLCAYGAIRGVRRMLRWPTDIALCPSGVRWRQGRQQRAILWLEVEEVRRDIKVIQRYHQTGLVGAFNQLNNPQPPLIQDTLWIKLHSGEFYLMSSDLVTDYNQFAERAKTLWAEDWIRQDTAGITDVWLKSVTPKEAKRKALPEPLV